MITSVQAVQWCLYYPAVLDAAELPLSNDEMSALKGVLDAYAQGDLTAAMTNLPPDWRSGSPPVRLLGAAVLLSAGQSDAARPVLTALEAVNDPSEGKRISRLATALNRMIATVKLERPAPLERTMTNDFLATEVLVESYRAQAAGELEEALAHARAAVAKNPNFSFAQVRVAELEFGFGRVKAAKSALARAVQLAPRNAQAVVLQGFIFSAENRLSVALDQFERAIALDGHLANGWLGRGLVRFRKGQKQPALDDLQMAATVEPQRAVLRSYLAKAWSETWSADKAETEIALAQQFDPGDPTAWLYSGLIRFRHNLINQSIEDLEHSQQVNENRSLFRSRLLLDQDAAVQSANLAAVYRDAGLTDVSVREGTRAVDRDYANASAHLFLAESYDALRDPRQVSLRYEAPWLNELLLANLLAPVGAGSLSQNISQQEYSKLLQRDKLGISSSTEYASRGDWREAGSLFGTFGGTSFAVDSYYASLAGEHRNTDLEQRTFYGKLKQQLTPQDTAFLQVIQYENTSGDVRQYYDPRWASTTLRFKEVQDPNIYAGWHHEWGPGSHTLFLFARLQDEINLFDSGAAFPTAGRRTNGTVRLTGFVPGFRHTYDSELSAYSGELQQIWQSDRTALVAGGRAQAGDVSAGSIARFSPTQFPPQFFGTTNAAASFDASFGRADLDRYSAYAYSSWNVFDPLLLTAGVSYDWLSFPRNVDLPPVSQGERNKDQWSPKAGLRWTIADETHLRAAYTRSLGGTYYDTSVRLEPSQVAGFNQAFRSAIPESVAGLVPGSEFETYGAAIDHKFTPTTFFGVTFEALNAEADRLHGAFNYYPPARPAQYLEALDYEEKSLTIDLNQLLGRDWVVGARYRLLHARLKDRFPAIPPATPNNGSFVASQNVEAILHQLDLNALWNHPSGLFAGFQASFFAQDNDDYVLPLRDDSFYQLNASLGYRFLQRRAEVRLALLNLTDQDYRLNPLNLHPDLTRRRTFTAQFSFVF